LGVNRTKVLRVFLLAVYNHFHLQIFTLPPLIKSRLKLVCNVNIVYRNLKSQLSRLCQEISTKLYTHLIPLQDIINRLRSRPLPDPVAAVAAVSTTQVLAGKAGPISRATPTIRAGMTAATAGTDGILPPTNSQEVSSEAERTRRQPRRRLHALGAHPSPTILNFWIFFLFLAYSRIFFNLMQCTVLLSLCKYSAYLS
jgi:hypothetical protein